MLAKTITECLDSRRKVCSGDGEDADPSDFPGLLRPHGERRKNPDHENDREPNPAQ